MAIATFTPDNVTMLENLTGGVPVEQGQQIIQDVMGNSVTMQLAKYEPMTQKEKEFDVFLNGIGAYWVGEGQRIQTTKPTWGKVKMTAHKLGVILPVSREYLTYKQSDFFEAMKPAIAEAFYKKFDAATILNIDNPYSQSIEESVIAESAVVEGDLNIENYETAVGHVNDAGFEVNGVVSKVQNRSLLRGLVTDNNGLKTALYDGDTLDGAAVVNMNKDIAEFTKGSLIVGDFDKVFYGIPYNMTYAISNDATLTTVVGDDGAPLNLFERDMVALRVTMDIGFMVVSDGAFAKVQPTETP